MNDNGEFTAIEILTAMKEELFENGWCKFEFTNEHGNVCMLGAVRKATWRLVGPGDWSKIQLTRYARYRAENLLDGAIPVHFKSVPEFNDHKDTNFDMVVDVIDAAIILGKEKGLS